MNKVKHYTLKDTARYAGLLLAPAEGFGLIMLCWPILGHLWCPVITLVPFFKNPKSPKKIQKNPKNRKKPKKIQKNHKKPKKSKNCQKWSKNPKI